MPLDETSKKINKKNLKNEKILQIWSMLILFSTLKLQYSPFLELWLFGIQVKSTD